MIKSAISFLLGCLLLSQQPSLPDSQLLWLVLATAIAVLFSPYRWLIWLLLGFSWSYYQASAVISDRLASELQGKDIVITGTVSTIPEYHSQHVRFEFRPDQQPNIQLPKKILLNWYRPFPISIHADERWQIMVRLKLPYGMKNPAGFDYESWLFQRGIGATGYIRSNDKNIRLAVSPELSINRLRQSVNGRLNQHLTDSSNLGVVEGLTTGTRHNISKQQWQLLRLSGTSHLLAISGLHIGLAAAIGFFSCYWLWCLRANNLLLLPAKYIAAMGGFLFALFYAALAGFSIPTERALMMVSMVMIALLCKRPAAISSSLAISLMLILIWDPLAVLAPGLWLSFTAVAIIVYTSQYRHPTPRWQWAKIHFLIALGLTPLLLVFFSQTSLISPLANLIAVPYVSLIIVPLSLLASIMLWLFEPIGILLLFIVDQGLTYFWLWLDLVTSLPFSTWSSVQLPLLYSLPISLGVILLLAPKALPAKYLAVFTLLPLLMYDPDKPEQGEFWFSLLDVGQGLASVIQTKNHTLVFDAGPKYSEKFDTGSAVVKPFLQANGINNIDILIISHGDNDHIGGAQSLLKAINTKKVLSSEVDNLTGAEHCQAGQSWQWDEVSFTMLHPLELDIGSDNNLSCVLRIANQAGSVLFTGDIEQHAEQLLIARYGHNLKSTILVAPHHGSNTSSSNSFISLVSPDTVLFPVGYKNRYHFPNQHVIDRYHSKQIVMLDTAHHGAIQYQFGQQQISAPLSWRQHRHNIWTVATTD
ncbi:DNA internalization-related competence protein ComEC/Rec2 [Methylophaga sp. 41_12_T18]|nr:DNA internalization-related competence protein ComEC/Rec2 [Methylophaga sp. 41_12_T18]